VLVGVQRGMVCFMADPMRKMPLQLMMDFMSISDYGGIGLPHLDGRHRHRRGQVNADRAFPVDPCSKNRF